jgi:hypothetical protein
MVPSMVNDLYIIRFAVCAKHARDDDMQIAFHTIQEHANIVLAEYRAQRNGRQSSSNDSLELTVKTSSANDLEQTTTTSEEMLHREVGSAIGPDQAHHPMAKVRVIENTCLLCLSSSIENTGIDCFLLFRFNLGEYNHNNDAPSSCNI